MNKKPLFPAFGMATQNEATPTNEDNTTQINLGKRYYDFYNSAFNLLASYFKANFAPTIPDNNFQIKCQITSEGFHFSVGIIPNDVHPAEVLHECVINLFRQIGAVVNEQELSHVTTSPIQSSDNGCFNVRIANDFDLMQLLDHLLGPYEMNLGKALNPHTNPKDYSGNDSFILNPLYSVEHVRALLLMAQGRDCSGQGLNLSH